MSRVLLVVAGLWAALISWHVWELNRVRWQHDRIEAVQ